MKAKGIRKKYEKAIDSFLVRLQEIDNEYNIFAEIEIINQPFSEHGSNEMNIVRLARIMNIFLEPFSLESKCMRKLETKTIEEYLT